MIEEKTILGEPKNIHQVWADENWTEIFNAQDEVFKEFKTSVIKLSSMFDLRVVKTNRKKNSFHVVVERDNYHDLPYRSLVDGVIFGEKNNSNTLQACCRITITYIIPKMQPRFVIIKGTWHTDNWKLSYE